MELQPFGPEEQAFQNLNGFNPAKKSPKYILSGVFVIIAITWIFIYAYTVNESKEN